MNSLLLTSILIAAFACTTPESSNDLKKNTDTHVIGTAPSDKIYMPTFKIYGELAPMDNLDGRSTENSITALYGFKVLRVAGCEITPKLVQSVKENNIKANEYMIQVHGENWKSEFEAETDMKFFFPI